MLLTHGALPLHDALRTPGHMAPEQSIGEEPADARADIYSLAMLGYEMLTGRAVRGVSGRAAHAGRFSSARADARAARN